MKVSLTSAASFTVALCLLVSCDSNLQTDDATPQVLNVPDEFTAVIGHTVGQELTPVQGSDGRWLVVYELMLTNGKQVPARVDRIEVLDFNDTSQVIKSISADELAARSVGVSARPRTAADLSDRESVSPVLQPNETMVVYIELSFDNKEDIADAIVHGLSGTGATNPGSRQPQNIEYLLAPKSLIGRSAQLIGPPLAGDGWVAVNGCCSSAGAHRGSIQTIGGELFNSQRFAIDWMRIGENGRFYNGDPAEVTNWYNYAEPVYAIADGTVIEVLDGLDDQPPGTLPDPGSITVHTVDGNHVILDLGDGIYAFYAHLKKGSVQVKQGDKVVRGEQLGELGNSGNTSGPHLHLHLMNQPSALASDSYPYVFDRLEITGQVDRQQWDASDDALGDTWTVSQPNANVEHTLVLPMDLDVVSFPGPAGN